MSAKKQTKLAVANVIYRATTKYLALPQPFRLLLLAVLLGLSSTTYCMEAPQDEKAAGRKEISNSHPAQSPSKEDQQAAWDKILPLISKRHGYVEPHEVEKALGIKFEDNGSEIIKLTVDMHGYMARPSLALPLQVNLEMFKDTKNVEQNRWSVFEVFFRDSYRPEDLSKPCLPAKQILQDLHQHEWRTQGPDLPEPGRIKGNTSLIAKNTTNDYIVKIGTDASLCLDSVSVYDRMKQ